MQRGGTTAENNPSVSYARRTVAAFHAFGFPQQLATDDVQTMQRTGGLIQHDNSIRIFFPLRLRVFAVKTHPARYDIRRTDDYSAGFVAPLFRAGCGVERIQRSACCSGQHQAAATDRRRIKLNRHLRAGIIDPGKTFLPDFGTFQIDSDHLPFFCRKENPLAVRHRRIIDRTARVVPPKQLRNFRQS